MQSFFKIFLFILVVSCNQNDSSKTNNEIESKRSDSILNNTPPNKDSIRTQQNLVTINNNSAIIKVQNHTDSIRNRINEKSLITLSAKILRCLKEKDYTCLAEFVHPKLGVRFSPHAYIDTTMDQLLSKKNLIALGKSQKRIKWGLDDATERAIKLSINNYIKMFVYDVDFLNAEKKAVNKFLGGGNSLNNLKEVYHGFDFAEFYFSGFDPKFGGMDWRSLRLVFKDYKKKSYLVAIVHDQWTI
jgi:hypothetical protein